MIKQYYKRFKILFEPIKYNKKWISINFVTDFFDGFQNIFFIHVGSIIIFAIETKNIGDLKFWVTIGLIIAIIKILNTLFDDSFKDISFSNLENFLTKKYLSKYIKLDNTKVEAFGTGKMNNIISQGIDSWIDFIYFSLRIIIELLAIIYIFVLVITKVPNIYYFIGFIFLFILIIAFYGKGISTLTNSRKKTKELQIINDGNKIKILMSKFEILQNNKFNYEMDKISNIIKEVRTLLFKGDFKKNLWQTGSQIILNGLPIIVYLVIGIGVIYNKYSIATLALLIWLLQILGQYSWNIRSYVRDLFFQYIHIDKLIDTFENIDEIKGLDNPIQFKYLKGNIKIDNLDFGYQIDNIFNNFSLELVGGKKTAFVGDSGSGKTTLMKLIAGYIYPKSGKIIVDKQNIADINLISYYKHIGYLTQEPSVFDGTIMENLVYTLDYEPNQKEIDDTIKNSKCEFIYDLPNGFETEIGEKGIKLSGGQKQRLAIAKIMLKNPNIILLDEPTSALDSISEQIVSEALQNLFKGKTVIVIAHRLQTVKEADEIIVLKKGKIIERGNHEELSKLKGGEYKKMLDLQTSF